MNKPEYDLGVFKVYENTLDDGSNVFSVMYRTPYGDELVAEPPSKTSAEALAEALDLVRSRFLDCGSDREVIQRLASLQEWYVRG
jgi:hypothetical protein